jgi:hypothetical protein
MQEIKITEKRKEDEHNMIKTSRRNTIHLVDEVPYIVHFAK